MGVYGSKVINENVIMIENMDEYGELLIFDELAQLSDAKKEEFINSEACKVMMEKGLIGKKTIVKLSKTDDLSRRMKMAAFQLAKEKEDPLWTKLVQNRIKEKQLIAAITHKYNTPAERNAKVAQRDYMKQVPQGFMRPATMAATRA